MSAPLRITNRFEIVTTRDAGALARILDLFARQNLAPSDVRVRDSHASSYKVSLTLESLEDDQARSLCTRLRLDAGVRQAWVEHLVSAA